MATLHFQLIYNRLSNMNSIFVYLIYLKFVLKVCSCGSPWPEKILLIFSQAFIWQSQIINTTPLILLQIHTDSLLFITHSCHLNIIHISNNIKSLHDWYCSFLCTFWLLGSFINSCQSSKKPVNLLMSKEKRVHLTVLHKIAIIY